ncbi:hypothetical protein Tco_1059827, partial [Tanacetum coccineum]
SDAGSPGVVVYGYDELPMHPVDPYVKAALQAPPSPDYVPGPEHPPSPDYVPGPEEPKQAPLSSDYIPEPEYPEYLEDPEEDSANYPVNGGDDVDDESSDDDDDDDDDDDEEQEASEDDDEEEEHLASTDSSAIPAVDLVSSAEDTEAFETDESAPTPLPSPRRRTARMFVRPQIPISDTVEALIVEYASAPTPPSPPPSRGVARNLFIGGTNFF